MGVTVNSLNGKEWFKALSGSEEFWESFGFDYVSALSLVELVEDYCGGWHKYYHRVKKYKHYEDYVRELYFHEGLGRDKVWEFIDSRKKEFNLWVHKRGDDYILRRIMEHNSSIMKFKEGWFFKEDDLFITICCNYIGYITIKLLNFVELNPV